MAPMIDGAGSAATLRFAVIQSRFNEAVTKHLLGGALEALRGAGAKDDAIDVISVPGAFEIPLIAAQLAKSQRYDALVCLGAVIRGQTAHFEYISRAVSQGIARVAYDYGIPVIFGVLTTDTVEQAEARATPSHKSRGRVLDKSRAWMGADDRCNKGYEAGTAAIEMANLMKKLPRKSTGLKQVKKNSRQNARPRRASMNQRHKARELALQVLFQWDIHRGATGWLEGFWDQHAASPESRQFAQSLVDGVIGGVAELDALISRYAENWTISRMACIDRNVLRMAVYELLRLPEVPARVTLNEAIDIVKRFGDEQSGAFVNGILDRILKEEPGLSVKAHESAHHGEKESVPRVVAPSGGREG